VINRRTKAVFIILIAAVYIFVIFFWGLFMPLEAYDVNYSNKFIPPCSEFLFGTDFMGRDMLSRSIKGMSNSLIIGIAAAAFSSVISLFLGIASAVFGGILDKFINLCVDLCMGLPHLVLLILISFMCGKGTKGVTIAVALTHWPALTRLVREEVMQVRNSQYVQLSYKMGKTKFQTAVNHIIPHIMPIYIIGSILLFPHAIMHEAAVTFLGFGLPPETPAIGIILSESMNNIASGKWWLALFPGLILLFAVILFDAAADNLKKLYNPNSGNE